MDDLTYSLRQLCRRNRDGSHATQADRQGVLTLASRQLREAGFRQMRATSLKEKHVEALLERWQAAGLSAGTLKNRLAHLRWWAEKVGKAGVIPADNARLGIPERRFVTHENKARELGDGLDRIRDPHVRMSLALQQVFGLRREECIKFRPRYADRGDRIVLKAPWTKGGRPRTVPITTPEQRAVLDTAHQLAGAGSLIQAQKNYIQQRQTYDGQCKAAGLSHMHGLRHRYAQTRYEALTGWKAPAAGGPSVQIAHAGAACPRRDGSPNDQPRARSRAASDYENLLAVRTDVGHRSYRRSVPSRTVVAFLPGDQNGCCHDLFIDGRKLSPAKDSDIDSES